MEHPAVVGEPVEDLAAALCVQVETQLFDSPAAADDLAHRRAREGERIRHRRAGAPHRHQLVGGPQARLFRGAESVPPLASRR
jgi:hypothetical protein